MSVSDGRPDPDALLRRVASEEARQHRAHLKLFFGYAPGVGKTYAMLEAAQRARAAGVDLVVGLVETHGRAETAGLAVGLETLPRRRVEHRGVMLDELDTAAIKSRRPSVVLVDELAHTNAPGSTHAKRWQDVLELLDAGIDVWSTLNVQHVESLNDAVAAVTHVTVKETVPDALLDRADALEVVDVPIDELLTRLRDGKVYLAGASERALESFFRRGNLLALRELALRRTAERVEDDVRAFRDENAVRATWPTAPRILVVVEASQAAGVVIRAGRRMADEADAAWVVAWVESPLAPLSVADHGGLNRDLGTANQLGARVVRLSGANVADAIIDYAHDENITQIVVGRPRRPTWRDVSWRGLTQGSLVEQLIARAHGIDVRVVGRAPEAAGARPTTRHARQRPAGTNFAAAAGLVAAATAVCAFIGVEWLASADIALVLLAVITVVAVRYGRRPSILAAALAVAGFDFFFVPPFYTFSVADSRHLLTFAMMFVVGTFVSGVAARLKAQEVEAVVRERRTQSVLTLTRATSAATDATAAATALAEHVAAAFQRETAVLLPNGSGALAAVASVGIGSFGTTERGVLAWAHENRRPAGRGTDTLQGSLVFALPLLTAQSSEGVLAILVKARDDEGVLDAAERELADAFARQTGAALLRLRLAEEARQTALLRRTEEMRSSLLSAVSHDLRTPLAAITGATTTLMDELDDMAVADQRLLLGAIAAQGFHLERLVGSLLDMTRVESGALVLRREWIPLEEIVGSSIARVRDRLANRMVSTALPEALPLLHVDPVLFEQVFVNLLDNATKYTPASTSIEIGAQSTAAGIRIWVADDGPGLPIGVDVFAKFVRGPKAPSGGVGLGLAICRGIIEAHGGTLSAQAVPRSGARFEIQLDPPPPPPAPAPRQE